MLRKRPELAARRRSRGYTQEALAHRLGTDVTTVARWERGVSTPAPASRGALASELAWSLEELAEVLEVRPAAGPAGPAQRAPYVAPSAQGRPLRMAEP